MVESQGAIVDRTLEHPGYGDRAILLLRKMIRDGVAAVANGETPKGVMKEDISLVDLDIGIEQYAIDKFPREESVAGGIAAAIGANMKSTGDAVAPLERLGFIGLGNMGGAIALRLLRAGYPLTILDLDADKMKPLVREGANSATTPGEIAERLPWSWLRCSRPMLKKSLAVRMASPKAKKSGLVFVDLSSTAPETAIKVSDALRVSGIEMLDAPVSGADIGATNGNLTLFVGGSYAAYQRCLPVLQHVGRMVTYLGKNGNGQVGKKINQMMQAMSELAIYEGMLLAKKTGLPLQMFARAASRAARRPGAWTNWSMEFLTMAKKNTA